MDNKLNSLFTQLSQVILGKDQQIKLALSCLFAGGHLLIEDIPGIGKTTLAKVLAQSLGLKFSRIQCTNDMLPGDILGVSILEQQKNEFVFHPGPVFSQVLLCDEINRATPKTQSALLEAMEEKQVTIDGKTYALEQPFFVIATQNPLEQAGTYALPESQLDRFLMRINLGYPAKDFETELLKAGGAVNLTKNVESILTATEVLDLQTIVNDIYISDTLFNYIQDLLNHSRTCGNFQIGLSPRAGLSLIQTSKAYAFLSSRDHVLPEDIQVILPYVVSHRLRSKENGQQLISKALKEIFEQVALPL